MQVTTLRVECQTQFKAVRMYQQRLHAAAGGVGIRGDLQYTQGRQFGKQFPTVVQSLDRLDYIISVHLQLTQSQWKDCIARHVARVDGEIGVIIGQIGVDLFNIVKKLHLAGRRLHLNLHHVHQLVFKDILFALPAERKHVRMT